MIDLVGEKYGRLTVVEFDRLQNHKTYWKCVCDCGLTVIATGNNLRSGNTQSCGCLHREKVADGPFRYSCSIHDRRVKLSSTLSLHGRGASCRAIS